MESQISAAHEMATADMPAQRQRQRVVVCGGEQLRRHAAAMRCCTALQAEVQRRGLAGPVERRRRRRAAGCAPSGRPSSIYPQGILYCRVQPRGRGRDRRGDAGQGPGRRAPDLPGAGRSTRRCPSYSDMPFFSKQVRIALRNCGIDRPGEDRRVHRPRRLSRRWARC